MVHSWSVQIDCWRCIMVSLLWAELPLSFPSVGLSPVTVGSPSSSLSHGLGPGGFHYHVISLWECLTQSCTKLNVDLFFRLWHPGVSSSKSNKICQTIQTLAPFMLCVYWMYMPEQISSHIFPIHSQTLRHTSTESISAC